MLKSIRKVLKKDSKLEDFPQIEEESLKTNDKVKNKVKKKKNKEFRIQTKELFLTYPKCEIEIVDALNQLNELLEINKYFIVRELHQDGSYHIHAYLRLSKVCDIKNPERLDLTSLKNSEQIKYHGNYQVVKKRSAVISYCAKTMGLTQGVEPITASSSIELMMESHSNLLEPPMYITNLELSDNGTEKDFDYKFIEVLEKEGNHKAME